MKKLALIGMGAMARRPPWNRVGWDCWSLNSGYRHLHPRRLPRNLTAWFEIHSRRYLRQEHYGTGHFKDLGWLPCPVYVQYPKEWPELQHPRKFPRHAIRRAFPRGDYHASSLDWMLAFALYRGYRHIECFGVEFGPTEGREPLSAQACMEYWVGFAEAKGVRVKIHEPTGLFWIYNYTKEKTPYHYDDTWRLIETR